MHSTDFDLTDPYDAAAMYFAFLFCDDCKSEPAMDPPVSYNLAHYHRLGQKAKAEGWVVVPSHRQDDVNFDIYCKGCAAARNLVASPGLRVQPNEALLVIAELANDPPAEVPANNSLQRP